MTLPATPSRPTHFPAAGGSPASQLEQDPTNSSGLRGSWPQDRTWCWAAVDSHGQPWTAMDSCGSGLAWLLGTHSGMCRMPPHSSPHFNKYLLSTCCVSVRDQGSGVSSPSPRADPAAALGVRYFSKRTVCIGPAPTCLPHPPPPGPLGQLAGATRREPSLQGAVHGAQERFPWEPGSAPPHLLLGVSAQLGAVPAL